MSLTLEQTLTSPQGFGLTTATPAQRAICRAIDGLPLGALALLDDVQAVFGGADACAMLPVGHRPAEIYLIAAIRSAKSLIAAAAALRASQSIDLSHLGPGETARVSVVSLTTDLAGVVFQHLVGTIRARPALRALLVTDPTTDSVLLRHPSGREIEVKVVAGSRAGASLVARWSAGLILDEAPKMNGADEGVVTFDDARRAIVGRLLPGAQMIAIGSPWAPFGPVYEIVEERFGKPTQHVVVARATGPQMNPRYWTPAKCEEVRERDPIAYRTDVLAEWADPESSLFEDAALRRCTRSAPAELPPQDGVAYAAAMDAATRANAWTLAIAATIEGRIVVVVARQWLPRKGQPLSPGEVLTEIARLCRLYGVQQVHADGWSGDAIGDLAKERGLQVFARSRSSQETNELFSDLKTLVQQEAIELPPVADVRSDLLAVRKRITQRSSTIELPRTGDGRHSDFAPAIALVASLAKGAESSLLVPPPPLVVDFDTMSIGNFAPHEGHNQIAAWNGGIVNIGVPGAQRSPEYGGGSIVTHDDQNNGTNRGGGGGGNDGGNPMSGW